MRGSGGALALGVGNTVLMLDGGRLRGETTDGQGMLEAYKPAGFEKLNAQFRDNRDNPTWTGMDAWASAICFNTAEGAKLGDDVAMLKDVTKAFGKPVRVIDAK